MSAGQVVAFNQDLQAPEPTCFIAFVDVPASPESVTDAGEWIKRWMAERDLEPTQDWVWSYLLPLSSNAKSGRWENGQWVEELYAPGEREAAERERAEYDAGYQAAQAEGAAP